MPSFYQCSVLRVFKAKVKLHRMERSRSNDVRSLGIELCTSRTDGRAITNCASNGALAMIGQIVRGGGGEGKERDVLQNGPLNFNVCFCWLVLDLSKHFAKKKTQAVNYKVVLGSQEVYII